MSILLILLPLGICIGSLLQLWGVMFCSSLTPYRNNSFIFPTQVQLSRHLSRFYYQHFNSPDNCWVKISTNQVFQLTELMLDDTLHRNLNVDCLPQNLIPLLIGIPKHPVEEGDTGQACCEGMNTGNLIFQTVHRLCTHHEFSNVYKI